MQNLNRNTTNELEQEIDPGVQGATSEFIASLLATLSEGFSAYAAALEIQRAQQEAISIDKSNADMQELRHQINQLTKDVKKITKALNI